MSDPSIRRAAVDREREILQLRPSGQQLTEVPVAIPEASACLRVHNTDLGGAIRALRKARRLTIEVLAMDAGMHPTYLSGIELGKRNPTWGKLADLAEALEIPMSVIVLDAEERCMEEAIRIAAADAYRAAVKKHELCLAAVAR
jgi:transcriptional regulator with XRE-family HTH domain